MPPTIAVRLAATVVSAMTSTPGPWRVVDVWESEEAFQRFGEVLVPVLQELEMAGEPQTFQVQNFVK